MSLSLFSSHAVGIPPIIIDTEGSPRFGSSPIGIRDTTTNETYNSSNLTENVLPLISIDEAERLTEELAVGFNSSIFNEANVSDLLAQPSDEILSNVSEASAPSSTPGFEVLFSILGLLIIACLARRRCTHE